ncbi:MAG TPA: hypothetical protein VN999_17655 [Thermoanaerobaculia bacterium]|nr:hypothetical protein [Thermoanaerobaculia bacterium]
MGESPAVEVEVKHYAGILRHAIRAAGFSVSEVERRLGAGPKSLRRVLGGQVDLKFKHVVAVLRIIGMPQEQFFAIAARRRRQRSLGGDLLAGFERGDGGDRREHGDDPEPLAGAAKSPGDAGSEDEFDRLVEEAVDRVLARRAREGKPLSPPPPLPDNPGLASAGGREAGDTAGTGREPG